MLVLGHATDEVMDTVGLGPAYRERTGASLFTVEAHVRYLDQVGPGELLEVALVGHRSDRKLLWIWHELWADGQPAGHGGDPRAARRHRFGQRQRGQHALPRRRFGTRSSAALVAPGPDASRSIRVASGASS